MEYKIKVNVSEDDYKKFNYDFYYHRIGTVIRLVIVFLMIAVVAVCSFLSFRLTGKISEFLPVIIILLAYVFIFFVLWPRKLAKLYKSDNTLQDEHELTLTESGITESSERGSYSYTSEDFVKVFFGKSVIAIYIALNKAILIPRHCFSSKEEEAQIESFIKEHYVKAKK